MRARDRIERGLKFVLKNADGMFVIVVALGVAVLQVFANVSQDAVDAAILSTLGVTAVVLLRDRGDRRSLTALEQMAGDSISDRPYEVVSQHNHWDLMNRERTMMRVVEQLRFTRNDVSTIADWSTGDGEVVRYDAKWKRIDRDAWVPAKKIHSFPIRNGEKVIYSLDEEHSRGDMLDWCIEREAVNRFPHAHESVTFSARTMSDDYARVVKITWPEGVDPSHIEIRYKGRPAQPLHANREENRVHVEETITELPVGESVQIAWRW